MNKAAASENAEPTVPKCTTAVTWTVWSTKRVQTQLQKAATISCSKTTRRTVLAATHEAAYKPKWTQNGKCAANPTMDKWKPNAETEL